MTTRPLALAIVLASCGVPLDDEEFETEPPDTWDTLEQGLVSCNFRPDTGYRSGNAFPVTLVTAPVNTALFENGLE